jgi:bifunctional non-homologous end joining protein LigD
MAKESYPSVLKPMLCTLVQKPFTKEGWIYEVKWDGYRILAYRNKKDVTLRSRKGLDYSDRYQVVTNAVKELKGDFVIDGEVVAFDEEGRVSFDLVQSANPKAPLAYYVFDITWKDGKNLMELPLTERKKILQSIVPANGIVKFNDSFPDGIGLYKQA